MRARAKGLPGIGGVDDDDTPEPKRKGKQGKRKSPRKKVRCYGGFCSGEKFQTVEFFSFNRLKSSFAKTCRECRAWEARKTAIERKGFEFVKTKAGEKQCTGCGRVLPRKEYNKNKTAADGLQQVCRACRSVSNARDNAKRRSAKGTHEPRPKPAPIVRAKNEKVAIAEQLIAPDSTRSVVEEIGRIMRSAGVTRIELDPRTGELRALVIVETTIGQVA